MSTTTTEQPKTLAVYNDLRAQLGQLKEYDAGLSFNYEDPADQKAARSHIYKLRQTRAAVDKVRKAEKAASLEYGRQVDQQAREIEDEISELINRHAAPIKAIEESERQRVADCRATMQWLVETGRLTVFAGQPPTADQVEDLLEKAEDVAIDPDIYQEFADEAKNLRETAIDQLEQALLAAQKREREEEELARLRAEAAERERVEREEKIAKEAAERAERQAADRLKAERERAKRRELELKVKAEEAAARAEREKQEAVDRARREAEATAAKAERERLAKEKAAQEEAERRAADKARRIEVASEITGSLMLKADIPEDYARKVTKALMDNQVLHVSVIY